MAAKSTLTLKNKAELIDIILEMQEKLKEVKNVESQINAEASELKSPAMGLVRDVTTGNFSIVMLKFDVETKASVIDTVSPLETKDQIIVFERLKKILGEEIFRKALGGKYV